MNTMKNGYRQSRYFDNLDDGRVEVDSDLIESLDSNDELYNRIILFYSYIKNLCTAAKLRNEPEEVNLSTGRIRELLGRKSDDAVKYLIKNKYLCVKQKYVDGWKLVNIYFLNKKNRQLSSISIDIEGQELERFIEVIKYDLNKVYRRLPELKSVVKGHNAAKLPENLLKENSEVLKKFIEFQKSPAWKKTGYYSLDIADRISSPITYLPKELRGKLEINGEKLISIDIRSSVPLLTAHLTKSWLKVKIANDKYRKFPSTLEKAIKKDILLSSIEAQNDPYKLISEQLGISRDKAKNRLLKCLNSASDKEIQKLIPFCFKYSRSLSLDLDYMRHNYKSWSEYYYCVGKGKHAVQPKEELEYFYFSDSFTDDKGKHTRCWAKKVLKKGRFKHESNHYRKHGYHCTRVHKGNRFYEEVCGLESDIMRHAVDNLSALFNTKSLLVYDEVLVPESQIENAKLCLIQAFLNVGKIVITEENLNISKQIKIESEVEELNSLKKEEA